LNDGLSIGWADAHRSLVGKVIVELGERNVVLLLGSTRSTTFAKLFSCSVGHGTAFDDAAREVLQLKRARALWYRHAPAWSLAMPTCASHEPRRGGGDLKSLWRVDRGVSTFVAKCLHKSCNFFLILADYVL
jgi:hypothetical protein